MNGKQLKLAVAAGVLALAGSLGVAGVTMAQTGTQPPQGAPHVQQRGPVNQSGQSGPGGQFGPQVGDPGRRGPGGPGGPGGDTMNHGPQMDQATIAKTLGIDEAALKTALIGGKTVADLAKDKGITLDTVVQAVIDQHVAQLKKDLPERFSKAMPQPPTGGQNDGRGPRGGGPFGELSEAVSKTLGIDAATLRTTLESGKTVADLAKDKNVSIDTVASALVAAHKTHMDAEVSSGRITQAQADADLTRFKNDAVLHLSESMPGRPTGPRPGGQAPDAPRLGA